MSFDARDLRPGLDVFDERGAYLGCILRIEGTSARHGQAPDRAPGDGSPAGSFTGESMGPVPTASLGNDGPAVQSATADYAASTDASPEVGQGSRLRIGRFGGLWGRRWAPVADVLAVAHERVVVRVRPTS